MKESRRVVQTFLWTKFKFYRVTIQMKSLSDFGSTLVLKSFNNLVMLSFISMIEIKILFYNEALNCFSFFK